MEEKQTISALIEGMAKEMERLQYSPLTISILCQDCHKFGKYVREKTGADFFSERIGSEYLNDLIGFPFDAPRPLTSREAAHVRCVRRLGEYQLYGAIVENRVKHKTTINEWALGDEAVISAYLEAVQTADNSAATKKMRTRHIRLFYEFLSYRKASGIQEMSGQLISDYALSLQGGSPVYTKHRLATLRFYFRFLCKRGYSEQDWSFAVPKVSAPKHLNVPTLWEKTEVERLLRSIDRSSPAGKRDYAVILLVVQFGLRISDVANLQLSNLKWERGEIDLIQHKTGNRIVHPMLGDVGWAIIDYIRYARPNVDDATLFLTVNAPYRQLHPGSIGCILQRNIQRCGIRKKPGTVSGMHSLRHALARRLLEQGTSLPEVADIMGHTSYTSTSPYLKVDIDGLRECSLSLGTVLANAE